MNKTDKTTPVITDEQLNEMSIEQLKALVLLQKEHIQKQEELKTSLEQKAKLKDEKIHELEFMNAMLHERLTLAQRKQFGISSEKYADGFEQLKLFNEAEQAAKADAPEPDMDEVLIKEHKRKKEKGKKEQDLSKFPTTEVRKHKLTGEDLFCGNCGTKRKVVTVEVTKTLKFVPAHFEVIEDHVYVYSCPKCDEMKRAKKPALLIRGSIATPSLVAGIINAKYVNSMPLDRQAREFLRYHLNLSTQSMANWLINCEDKYLFRIYQRMKEIILTIRYVHCDETRVQVLDEANQKASTENWMWVYRTGELSDAPQMALFSYARTRGAYHPKEFLDGYAGYLTCDGYQAYHGLSDEITVTGCMSHCRRRFEQCLTILKKDFSKEELKETTAYRAMEQIGKLYQIEKEIRELTPDERYKQRQERSKPLLDVFFKWLYTLKPDVDRSSKIGEAILYAINQERYLRGYLEDGHLSIDNNAAERAIKNFAVGRRNWLFCKSIAGAEASATIYSITETALMNGLKPFNYITHILTVMSEKQEELTRADLMELLPWSKSLPEDCYSKLNK